MSRQPFRITRELLIHILSLSEEGVAGLYGIRKKSDLKYQWLITSIENMSFESALTFLIVHPELFCTPIIFDEKKLQLGYNREDIRKFIPKETRKVEVIDKISQVALNHI